MGMLWVLTSVKCLEKCLISATYFPSQGKYKRLQMILLHVNSDFLGISPSSAVIFLFPDNLCFFSVFWFNSTEQAGVQSWPWTFGFPIKRGEEGASSEPTPDSWYDYTSPQPPKLVVRVLVLPPHAKSQNCSHLLLQWERSETQCSKQRWRQAETWSQGKNSHFSELVRASVLELGTFRAEGLPLAPFFQTLQLVQVIFGLYHSQQGVKCYVTELLSEVRRTLRMLNTKSSFIASRRLKYAQEPEKRRHLNSITNLLVIWLRS